MADGILTEAQHVNNKIIISSYLIGSKRGSQKPTHSHQMGEHRQSLPPPVFTDVIFAGSRYGNLVCIISVLLSEPDLWLGLCSQL